ncbi:hypothetical protein EDC01DRAFT_675630 [Geopyxis carbonaria]|nr:hypothetical protein EDC01DRAFT_675630 [Geopyxis carbonaria]
MPIFGLFLALRPSYSSHRFDPCMDHSLLSVMINVFEKRCCGQIAFDASGSSTEACNRMMCKLQRTSSHLEYNNGLSLG